jgi:hypothetical protein
MITTTMLKSQQEFTELTLYYADVEHNNETASFIVIMVTSVCTEDVDCIDNAQQIFGGKMKTSLLFTADWSGWLLVLLSCFLQEMLPVQCSVAELRRTTLPALAFIASSSKI